MDYEKFKRHCNMGVDIELENDDGIKDVFKLKPLNIKQILSFDELAHKYNEGKLTKQDTEEMINLFIDVVINSYPNLEKDIAESFAINNLPDFMLIMDQLAPRVDKRKVAQLQKMKQLQEAKIKEESLPGLKEDVEDNARNTENTE